MLMATSIVYGKLRDKLRVQFRLVLIVAGGSLRVQFRLALIVTGGSWSVQFRLALIVTGGSWRVQFCRIEAALRMEI
jgi:hypothetical protein